MILIIFSCDNSKKEKINNKIEEKIIVPENEELLKCIGKGKNLDKDWHFLILAGIEHDVGSVFSIVRKNQQFLITAYELSFNENRLNSINNLDSCTLTTNPAFKKVYFNFSGEAIVSENKLSALKDENLLRVNKTPFRFDAFVISFYEYSGTIITKSSFTYEGENDSLEILFHSISKLINN